jgi:hypothetical protein
METDERNGKLIFVFCYGLIGAGKSFVFSIIKELVGRDVKLKKKINLMYISSDEIKAQKIREYQSSHKCNFQEAHDKINMKSKNAYNKTIFEILKTNYDINKINLFLVDKLFFPSTLNEFHQ